VAPARVLTSLGMNFYVSSSRLISTTDFTYDHTVQEAARARKESFASSNPLSLGGGGLGARGSNMKTPLGWLTGKLTGVGAR
jgi:AP-3 complex subunit sigma